jgi:amidohydrolase
MNELADRVAAEVERRADTLIDVSHLIWKHPELCYEEQFAHDLLCDVLEGAGFDVTRGAYDLDTAFEARAGSGGPTIAVCCEYDALPEIGHACGHNVIAAAGLGAGLAAGALADELGGTVVVLGTPAEEGGGGKILMLDRGALDGVDAAMMVHPADQDLDGLLVLANHQVHVRFTGEAAHAAAAPHKGRNALDAAVLAYVNVAALRQHIEGHERIHGIITHGGDKPNIVPHRSAMQWYVRSADAEGLEKLTPRVVAAIEAGALATGCEVEIEYPAPPYSDLITSRSMLGSYAANMADRGRTIDSLEERPEFMGSTDMGNVSYEVPTIHPMIQVAPRGVAIHTPEFATHTAGPGGDKAVVDGAVAMARTIVDLWTDDALLRSATAEFASARDDSNLSDNAAQRGGAT